MTNASDTVARVASSIRNSQLVRLFAVLFLVLLLQIPVLMIGGLVQERLSRRQSAVAEVSSKWGNAQAITGPALVLPYTHRWLESAAGQAPVARSETRHAIFLPEKVAARGRLAVEIRSRGIFTVPVYRLDLQIEGEFERPNPAELGINPADAAWERAYLAVGISDVRAIQESTAATWNGRPVAFLPGTGAFADDGAGIHSPVGLDPAEPGYRFSFPLSLNGSQAVYFTPFARDTVVELEGNHGDPSFQGNWLPGERTVSTSAFKAKWTIPFLGRGYPQAWKSESNLRPAIDGSRFGVELVEPVDQYRMAERSVKYAGLFILLTFAAIWLFEVLAGIRVHAIQYLLLGAALCLFYLLELSLSEHLGFPPAYALASVAVVGMVGAYSGVVLRRAGRALFVAAGVALLYVYLFILLTNEDYALLIGSIGLFVILGAIMVATRKVDWYAVGGRPTDAARSIT